MRRSRKPFHVVRRDEGSNPSPSAPVIGVDWFKGGWVAVVLGPAFEAEVLVSADLAELIDRAGDPACVGVDMPIGLPENGTRASDRDARAFVGVRRNSVFMTPPQAVLEAATYAEANEVAVALLDGKRISQQAWALRRNIAAVAQVAENDPRVIEVHPEVSFRAMTGTEVAWPKTTWNGQAVRRAALAVHGIVLPDTLDDRAGAIPPADVLDAAAVAWTARRHAANKSRSLPDNWERGTPGAIWY
jgi:predicted RNase H-like nuclease